MDVQTTLTKIKEQVEKAKSIVIVTHKNPSMDSLGSSLSLYLGLLGLGKSASVVCPDPVTVEFANFVGADKLETKIAGKKNFIISLDYQEGSIEKVSYNIEGNKFNLVIEPRPGFEEFSKDKVHYTYTGSGADLIITVGISKFEELVLVYEENKELFGGKPIINIDCHTDNTLYGAVNCIDTNVSSVTELIAVVMSFIGVKLTEDIATNLFNAIIESTDHFQKETVNARTFEVASVCMKAGAKRFPKIKPQPESIPVLAQDDQSQKQQKQGVVQEDKTGQTKEDWLKPKIFKNPNTNT